MQTRVSLYNTWVRNRHNLYNYQPSRTHVMFACRYHLSDGYHPSCYYPLCILDSSNEESSDSDRSENGADRLMATTTPAANARELVESLQARLPSSQELEQEAE